MKTAQLEWGRRFGFTFFLTVSHDPGMGQSTPLAKISSKRKMERQSMKEGFKILSDTEQIWTQRLREYYKDHNSIWLNFYLERL